MEKKDSSELNLPLFGFADPNATGKNVAVYILDAPYTPSKVKSNTASESLNRNANPGTRKRISG
jgi:hypothetical protein